MRLERLVDFGDLPIFHDAVTYPMIMLTSKVAKDEMPIQFTRIRQFDEEHLDEAVTTGEVVVPRALLTSDQWPLDSVDIQAILGKIKAVGVPLGEYVNGKIYRGILTGFNEAFILDERTRKRLVAQDSKSAEIIKPFVIPIRRIAFTTPDEERAAHAAQGSDLYRAGQDEALLVMVETCLAAQPEQSDVVHDLLVFLAEQMLDLQQKRAAALDDVLLALEGVLSDADLQKINRLWTPPAPALPGLLDEERQPSEAEEKLGTLATRQIDLRDDIGLLSEEQWKWLMKRRLGKPDIIALTKVFRTGQPPVAALDQRIAATERLIDQVVYRLYGLTPDEMAEVEKRVR